MLEYWSTRVLEYWSAGVLEHLSTGVLEYWTPGVLEYWSTGARGAPLRGTPSLLSAPGRVTTVFKSEISKISSDCIPVFLMLHLL